MKKNIIILFLIFSSVFSFSQKKELYVNDDFEYISKVEFDKKHDHPLGYSLRLDLDSCYINVKVSRYKKGEIKKSLYDSIVKTFISDNQRNVYDFDVLLINYYPGDDSCSTSGYKTNFKEKYKKFYKKVDKLGKIKHLFVYKSDDGLEEFEGKIDWQPDINNVIENIFYPIDYPCGGYVIIDSEGNYISQRGEYCYEKPLIQTIKELID